MDNKLPIRINTEYCRISINRKTIAAIGDPTFIHLGYDPDIKSLMILGTWVDDTKAVRVTFTRSGSFYIYSKKLIEGIRQVGNVMTYPGSYLLYGIKIKNAPAISFCLADADKMCDGIPGESSL